MSLFYLLGLRKRPEPRMNAVNIKLLTQQDLLDHPNDPPPPPKPPVEAFRLKTITVLERLNEEISRLRAELDHKSGLLAQLERVRSAEELALNHLED